ncbi:MAG: amino acid permease, partial [Bacteroidota bacterium]|nr:amino acid permease [Bacteroidota bacterium]
MSTQKKFGTFSGVLTPSLLTILGVIMYMRLGSVVGYSSGIFQVVLIIVFSHLISVTTGLSVSSIATDKKIDKGGIYYMLTRSLGLPIGGAIGLTIFFATALSIALYLIGFSESLIPVLNDAFGIGEITVNKLRLIGTIALLLVLAVAYISTSFALKIQYVILALIILSLGSIFLGSAKGLTAGNDQISSPNFAVLFGIFFPAVTGFTAGVAMSGDLKSPRISIPWGTMLSITIGLVVYLALAFFIYYNIDSEILKTNNNVLIEFGAIPLLVLGGVWGATLSSALGGILGGPRILQAMSLDLITPKIFAKGHGVNNEPRNALFLTFIIAEMGILIGELNVIAELVAMFYMAAYLFINISCFLEQWSSPDFRPKFKIPIAVSLVGAIATFLLMIQLNLAATLVAVIVMMAFWFWLSKKDLVLGTGDVWFSVWTSIVKTALKNLQKKSVHKRNWQPNILLFSGGTNNRPHLIEFSKSIMGRGGMVSNFDLIEVESASTLFPKSHQIVKDEEIADDTIFHRKLYCQNIFKGIETIANTYGFTGVDPNTILMGWARNTKDPKWFGEMTNKLKDLDYNILFLDYDQDRGFGKYAEINIWWTEFNKQNELGLQMVKFLRNSPWWKSATLKIYYVNNADKENKQIEQIIQLMLDKKRMRADVVVIDNTTEQKDINDHIKTRSHEADLILMDLPLLEKDKENDFIEASNLLFTTIGSALFIEASSAFEISDIKLLKSDLENVEPKTSKTKTLSNSKPELIKSHDTKLDDKLGVLQNQLIEFNNLLSLNFSDILDELTVYYQQILDSEDHSSDTIYQLYDSEYILKLSEEIADQMGVFIDDYHNKIL